MTLFHSRLVRDSFDSLWGWSRSSLVRTTLDLGVTTLHMEVK